MAEADSFDGMLGRLRVGDDEAATRLFQRFTQRLVGLARAHLDSWLGRKEDPEDVVQSVYKSFFARVEDGQFDFATWGDLWSLLTVITLRKCADRVDYYRAQRRDAAAEISIPGAGACLNRPWESLDRSPTPEEAAILTETVEHLLRGLAADDRSVVEMSLQGYSTQEISGQLGRTERTVQRLRRRVKDRLKRMQVA